MDSIQSTENLSKLISDALKREVPHLSEDEIKEYRRQFYHMRSEFSAWCVSNQMYYTLALLTTCEIRMDEKLPALAAIVAQSKKLEVVFHPLAIEIWEANKYAAYFLFCHELRHIVQACSLRSVEELIDLEPIREVYLNKQKEATTQEAKEEWQRIIDSLDDKENKRWRNQRHAIANITMDAALHQDVFKVFDSHVENQVNEFLRNRFVPYLKGFSFETIAKDSVVAGSSKEELEEQMKNFGPNKRSKLESFIKEKERSEEEILAEAMKMNIHIQTVPSLIDMFNGSQGFQTSLDSKTRYEWLQLADEYTRWLAHNIQESADPNNPESQEGEGDQDSENVLDSHDFGDPNQSNQAREELERKVRDAIRRSEQEAKAMAHRAGTSAGDADMMGDSTEKLNSKIQETLRKMKIKFIRIFADSNQKKYFFSKINRIFSEINYLPGQRKEEKPSPQVVLVLDTSGSMWCPQYVNQMLAMARMLHKENKLHSMYYCDTELHKVDFNASASKQAVLGGGGTELNVETCEKIQSMERLSKGWELVYATDEYCYGLEEAKKDPRWKIHVINVPNMLA